MSTFTTSPVRAIASTPYDTAWVAAIPHPTERRDPRFPSALNWITGHQHPDGSWGSQIPYVHDRLICTLAALIPLARYGRRDSDRAQLRHGERFLWQQGPQLMAQPCTLVGFELLLPTLCQMAIEAGVRVPPYLQGFAAERDRKLALIPPQMVYSPNVTIAHSLEFLGSAVNPLQLLSVRAPNGSIGNSPAATAFLLHHVEDGQAAAYLERCLAADQGAGAPVLEPCETFEALWMAHHRFIAGVPATEALPTELHTDLLAALQHEGVSLSPSFPVPDADDTAVALLLLHEAGYHVDPAVLQRFERSGYFVSFPFERHPSTGVNVHVLQTLIRFPQYPDWDTVLLKILDFLHAERQHNTFWFDKWHISPYYATSHAVIALQELPEPFRARSSAMIAAAVDWLLQTQNNNGSWGFYGPATVEETAYAVLGLLPSAAKRPDIARAVQAGRTYIETNIERERPAMWIDKCLYYPPRIVDAVVRAALF